MQSLPPQVAGIRSTYSSCESSLEIHVFGPTAITGVSTHSQSHKLSLGLSMSQQNAYQASCAPGQVIWVVLRWAGQGRLIWPYLCDFPGMQYSRCCTVTFSASATSANMSGMSAFYAAAAILPGFHSMEDFDPKTALGKSAACKPGRHVG